ncbi:unnamed protein product [Moneuplotes crassus]|uniref:MORN repeat protein n=1 Tax=Euplotes crassus TaxID=5936 RepID=A0AAD1UQ30_EUPCR|nr:unnamed protein product [Moneuplotes crassus]
MGNCVRTCTEEIKAEGLKSIDHQVDYVHSLPNKKKEEDRDKFYQENILKIINIQAIRRGNRGRKEYEKLLFVMRKESRYFRLEESQETIQKGKVYNFDQPRATKKYTYKSGAVYEGEWKGGFRDGIGTQKWPDGAIYEGSWRFNKAEGKGKFTHVDGDIYEGDWVDNKANGFGVYNHNNGATYHGYWKNDLQDGQGSERWTDNSEYEGEYQKGKKHGYGVYKWNDGSIFEGQWFMNKICGVGIYSWLDGRKYRGEWIDNNMGGFGFYLWKDGRKFYGQYKNDKKHGYGIYKWADGRTYQGSWAFGKQHGLGRYTMPGAGVDKYGIWENGRRIEWLDSEVVQNIKDGDTSWTKYFRNNDSAKHIDIQAGFTKPKWFDTKLLEVSQKIGKLGSF